MKFDGKMAASSADTALYSAFLYQRCQDTFLDELGPESSPAWKALVDTANNSYSAQADHLLGVKTVAHSGMTHPHRATRGLGRDPRAQPGRRSGLCWRAAGR